MRGQEGRELRSGRREGRQRDEGKGRVDQQKQNRTLRNSKMMLAYALKPYITCSMRLGLAAPCVTHADGREG